MTTKLRILAVDDELGMLSGIKRTVRDFTVPVPDADTTVDFEVTTVDNGEDAIEVMKQDSADILLLDYKLPGIDGLTVLQEASKLNPEALSIMITAYASIETAISATKKGAYDFLPKPFTPADLRHTLRKAAARIVIARRARALEEERKRVRFEFIRVLGHELKAPINAVSGYLSLMHDRSLGEELKLYDTAIDRSLVRLEQMRKLIIDLLDMTRIESGSKRRELEAVDIIEAARQSMELVEKDAGQRSIEITLDAPDKLVMPLADRGEIDMMFNNLVSNAVKYNRDNGKVTIQIQEEDGMVNIAVQDTGIGMTEEECERLFGEFVRIKNEKTKDVLGSGLGLSILKRLAELYQGSVSVSSQPDVGSTFTVRLKRAVAEGDGEV